MRSKSSCDYYLLLATVAVLFAISLICVYAMFYFKLAQVQEMAPAAKSLYLDGMNKVVAPFVIALILLLGICVPKRLLPVSGLNRFALVLLTVASLLAVFAGLDVSLLAVLIVSLALQLVVLVQAVSGSSRLHFSGRGYWLRLGSSLIHLGLILFILDLFLYRYPALHLALFWITTGATVTGMIFAFYAGRVAGLFARSFRDGQ